jgi:predicted permease
MRTREFVEQGLSQRQARERAEAIMGDVDRLAARCERLAHRRDRRFRILGWWTDLFDDLRFSLRQFVRKPAASLTIALVLALGIGAVVSVWSVVYSILLDPIPLPDSRLVHLIQIDTADQPSPDSSVSPLEFQDLERTAGAGGAIEQVSVFRGAGMTLLSDNGPDRVDATLVSRNFFQTLAAGTVVGQPLAESDYQRGAAGAVLLSYRFWRQSKGAEAAVVGQTVTLNGRPYVVRGVLTPALERVFGESSFYLPIVTDPEFYDQRASYLQALARLAPGATPRQADAELTAALAPSNADLPAVEQASAVTAPLRDLIVGDFDRRLYLLFGTVSLVLLVACANAANLLLAQGLGRRNELAVRSALGAGRSRILRQLLAESVFVAGLASIAALVLAWGLLRFLTRSAPDLVPGLDRVRLGGPVLVFALLLAVLVALLVGALPAIKSQRVATRDLRGGSNSSRSASLVRRLLVAAQVAVTLVLLVAAGLLIRSAIEETQVEPGFDPERVLSVQLSLPAADYPDVQSVTQMFDRLLAEAASIPGVTGVGVSNRVPLVGSSLGLEFGPPGEDGPVVGARFRLVSAGYFKTMAIPVLSGREFDARDRSSSPLRVLVNQSFVSRFWPGEPDYRSVVGRAISSFNADFRDEVGASRRLEVLGVVADARDYGLASEMQPEVYMVLDQVPPGPWSWIGNTLLMVLRTEVPPEMVVAPLRDRIRAIDPSLPVSNIATLEERLSDSLLTRRYTARIYSVLALLALLLAVAGTYSVTQFFLAQQRFEIALRLALGATKRDVTNRLVRKCLIPAVLGAGAGLIFTLLTLPLLESQLFGLDRSGGGWTVAGLTAVLLVIVAMACLLPSRRAAEIEPARVLRSE